MTVAEQQRALGEEISQYIHDPAGMALYAFPWGTGDLADSAGPRKWQGGILDAIGTHLQNKQTRHQPCLIAVASGKGIGKSALVGIIIDWAMSTCEDCKVILTANTDGQLRTKTWPEVCKWFGLAINKHWFSVKAESITIRNPEHERLWRCDRIAWSEHNTEAFAGLHNKGKRILIIFDEASAISDKIWETTEGVLTDEDTEIIWLAFGNPTRTDGRFRECFGKFKHRWKTWQIDSREVEGINKAEINRQVEDYGEDSDHVRVWVRGEFPRTSVEGFISAEVVEDARKYKAEGYQKLPLILAVDVARFGDNETVIGWRQGRKFVVLDKLREKDGVFVANKIIQYQQTLHPSALIVDGDGGWSGSIVDHLKFSRFDKKLHEFHGSPDAYDSRWFNRRTEVWGLMKEWLGNGAQIPDDPDLATQLTGPTYDYTKGKRRPGSMFVEHKDSMKSRGLASPDIADCLALTFAVKVAPPAPQPKKEYAYPGERTTAWME
jgi:hypothetical protein